MLTLAHHWRRVMCIGLTWVIRLESDNEVAQRSDHQCIAPHGCGRVGRLVARVPVAFVIVGPNNDLEIVAVKMERVLTLLASSPNRIVSLEECLPCRCRHC
jgi:hypothetical protein